MPKPTTARQQIHSIRRSITAIERALNRLTASLNGQPGNGSASRRLELSPKRKAALKLHGSYLGHIRLLKPRQKARVKAVQASKGYHAAIALAKKLGRG